MRTGLLITLAACYSPNPATGVPCAANGECPSGQVCDMRHAPPVCVASLPTRDAPVRGDAVRLDGPGPDGAVGQLLVQQVTASNASTGTLSATLAARPAAGHVLVMIGASAAGALMTVSGAGVATWSKAAASDHNVNEELWYGTTDGSDATVTITLVNGTPPQEMFMDVTEWSGLVASGALDTGRAASGVVSPASAGAIVTSHAHDLLLFGVSDNQPPNFGTPTAGTWTALTPIAVGAEAQGAWYQVVTSAGSSAPTVTETPNYWDAVLVALQVAP